MGVSRVVVHIPHHHHLPSTYPIGYLSSPLITSTSLPLPLSLLSIIATPYPYPLYSSSFITLTHHHLYLLPLALPSTYHHYLPT